MEKVLKQFNLDKRPTIHYQDINKEEVEKP